MFEYKQNTQTQTHTPHKLRLQDEGWALGLKEKGGVKGMFPINFTRRVV